MRVKSSRGEQSNNRTPSDDDTVKNLVLFKQAAFNRRELTDLYHSGRLFTGENGGQNQEPAAEEAQEREEEEPQGVQNQEPAAEEVQELEEEQQVPPQATASPDLCVDIPWVEALRGVIGRCSEPFEKTLTASDVKGSLGRLLITRGFAEKNLVPMLNKNEDVDKGIYVNVYDLKGRVSRMKFVLWSDKFYVLTSGWKEYQQRNNLWQGTHTVTLWMFRHVANGKLCFLIKSRIT